MGNKRTKSKKPKQSKADKMAGKKGGRTEMDEFGSPQPVRKQKKR